MDEQNPGQPDAQDPQAPGQLPPPPPFSQPQPPPAAVPAPPGDPYAPPADPYAPPAAVPAPPADPYAPPGGSYGTQSGPPGQPGQPGTYPPPVGGAPYPPPAGPGGVDPYGPPPGPPPRKSTVRIILGVIAAVIVLLAVGRGITHNNNRPSVAPTQAKDIDARKMQVGDCIKTAAESDNVTTVPYIACSQPHAAEVYYVLAMTDSTYPGTAAVEKQVEAACSGPEFTAYVGKSAEASSLDVFYLYPTSASFAQGDRAIDCLAGSKAGNLTGSVKGSNK